MQHFPVLRYKNRAAEASAYNYLSYLIDFVDVFESLRYADLRHKISATTRKYCTPQ
jgi:hypothetical protein